MSLWTKNIILIFTVRINLILRYLASRMIDLSYSITISLINCFKDDISMLHCKLQLKLNTLFVYELRQYNDNYLFGLRVVLQHKTPFINRGHNFDSFS